MFESWIRQRIKSSITSAVPSMFSLLLLFFIAGCAPTLYSVDLKYMTSDAAPPISTSGKKFIITVAAFNDARPGGEDLLIGRVTTAMGDLTSIIPKTMKPSDAVSTIVKDVLVKSGYQVSVAMPVWNLQESEIRKEWGKLLIGGSINELEVFCQNDIPIKTYDSRVRVTMVIADVQTGKIIYQVSAASRNSLEHVYFSEEMLSQQISGAITEAVEKAFEGNALKEKIQNALK
ncbi:MAG: hypothetical protein V1766_10040 [Pseudomonadota bacterium]